MMKGCSWASCCGKGFTLAPLAPAVVQEGGGSLCSVSPMSLAFLGTMRRCSRIILMASRWISKRLLQKASSGARGKAATKMVVKLYWITVRGSGVLVCSRHTIDIP